MKVPNPNGSRCVVCREPCYAHESVEASKPKGSHLWVYAHTKCLRKNRTEPTKKADTGVRYK